MINTSKHYLKNAFRQYFDRWLKKRMPPTDKITLSAQNIFILPSGFGLGFIGFIILIFLLGVNYNNNVILLFSYLLGSFFITAMLHSFYNLSGLIISHQAQNKGFAEQSLSVPIVLNSTKARFHLLFSFAQQHTKKVDFIDSGVTQVDVPFYPEKRGVLATGRLKLTSRFSFGLFRTWTQLDFSVEVLAFPTPIKIDKRLTVDLSGHQASAKPSSQSSAQYQAGQDDFYALTAYQVGQPLSHVAWKQVARWQSWLTKQYQKERSQELWLALENMPSNHLETKLSMLCYLAVDLHKKGEEYGVTIGDLVLAPTSEHQQHLDTVLIALAKFQQGYRPTENIKELS